MRAGGLDRMVTIQRRTLVDDGYGTIETWSDLASVFAQVRQQGGREYLGAAQVQSERRVVFTMRWFPGLSVVDRVEHEGEPHNIVEVREIGRREGVELHTVAAG